jgi:hypothetical protein
MALQKNFTKSVESMMTSGFYLKKQAVLKQIKPEQKSIIIR